MKVNLTKTGTIVLASEAKVGEVYLLIHLCTLAPPYAICLDEYDNENHIQFADFNGIIHHVRRDEQVQKVSFAEVTIKD